MLFSNRYFQQPRSFTSSMKGKEHEHFPLEARSHHGIHAFHCGQLDTVALASTTMRDDQTSTMTGDRYACNQSRTIQRLPGFEAGGDSKTGGV
jgi:hypothetical protein